MTATDTDGANDALQPYGLTRPTAAEALTRLTRVVGADRARQLWERCCDTASVDPERVDDLSELMRVAACMITLPGPEGVMGASLALRIGTYEALVAAGKGNGGSDP